MQVQGIIEHVPKCQMHLTLPWIGRPDFYTAGEKMQMKTAVAPIKKQVDEVKEKVRTKLDTVKVQPQWGP